MIGITSNMRPSLDWADKLMLKFFVLVPAHTIEPFSLSESLLRKYKIVEGKIFVSLYSTSRKKEYARKILSNFFKNTKDLNFDEKIHVAQKVKIRRSIFIIIKQRLLKIFNIPLSIMPGVTPNIYEFGSTNLFGDTIKIGGMAGDQQASTIGQACFDKGQAKSTYGTGCFLLMNIGKNFKLSKNKLLTTVAYKIGKEKMYCYEGSIFVAGSAVQWLRDKLKLFKSSHQTNKLYSKAKKDEKIIIVPALTGLGAPHWEPDVRGAIFGLTRNKL